jgi:hypothetical protein
MLIVPPYILISADILEFNVNHLQSVEPTAGLHTSAVKAISTLAKGESIRKTAEVDRNSKLECASRTPWRFGIYLGMLFRRS